MTREVGTSRLLRQSSRSTNGAVRVRDGASTNGLWSGRRPWVGPSSGDGGPICLRGNSPNSQCAQRRMDSEFQRSKRREQAEHRRSTGGDCPLARWRNDVRRLQGKMRRLPGGWPGAARALDASSALPALRLRCSTSCWSRLGLVVHKFGAAGG